MNKQGSFGTADSVIQNFYSQTLIESKQGLAGKVTKTYLFWGHFHTARDRDVRQIRVQFLALKSAKGVFLASKISKRCHFQAIKVSNFRKIIIFFNQITEILRNSVSIMQRYTARNYFPAF